MLLYRKINDRTEWIRLKTKRVMTGWYTDSDLRKPATEAQADAAGDDIYTAFGRNVEPKSYPVVAHIEAAPKEVKAKL